MKTLFVSLAALAAVSGTALAADGNDPRKSDSYLGSYSARNTVENYATDSNALIISKGSKKKTAFERMNEISEQEGGKANDRGQASTL